MSLHYNLAPRTYNLPRRGFALIEILIASAIISASMFALLSVGQKSIELSRRALAKVQASFLLEEGAEVVKIVREGGWNAIEGFAAGTPYYPALSGNAWTLSEEPSMIGNFTRTVEFS